MCVWFHVCVCVRAFAYCFFRNMKEVSEQLSGVFSLLLDGFVFSVSPNVTVTATVHHSPQNIVWDCIVGDCLTLYGIILQESQLEIAVKKILIHAGAEDYIPVFARHRITIETMMQLDDADLKQVSRALRLHSFHVSSDCFVPLSCLSVSSPFSLSLPFSLCLCQPHDAV